MFTLMAQDNTAEKNKNIQVTLTVTNKVITGLCLLCCGFVSLIAIAALIWEKWDLESVLKNVCILGLMIFLCHASFVLYIVTDFFTIIWSILTTPYGTAALDAMGVQL